jgi:hypothetical protein
MTTKTEIHQAITAALTTENGDKPYKNGPFHELVTENGERLTITVRASSTEITVESLDADAEAETVATIQVQHAAGTKNLTRTIQAFVN